MADVDDGYDLYYGERLWQLLPAVYRTADTDRYPAPGPLRELVGRLGAQIAVVRRSIDRMWADQSVETCDDWVIPYVGDLLGVNLVAGLDAPAQRVDVGKTIHYRRRKGTVAVLEEIAADVTGWEARIVEGMRRLARTGHGLDPALGLPPPPAAGGTGAPAPDPRVADGRAGLLTGTPSGGLADLRAAHAAALTGTAFDEYASTADVRAGHGVTGWPISRLLVFVWRLASLGITGVSPVGVTGCANQYVFDPTGRQVPLFLRPRAPADDADTWVPAREWEVPGRLTTSLLRALRDPGGPSPAHAPYPDVVVPSYSVASIGTDGTPAPIADASLTVWPELGRFEVPAPAGQPPPLEVGYHYGFAAMIGAGPYDRELLAPAPAAVQPVTHVAGGGASLGTGLSGLPQTGSPPAVAGTVIVDDSLTYTPAQPAAGSTAPAPVSATSAPAGDVLVQAGPRQRPAARIDAGAEWVFTGAGPSAELTLDGLLISGGDVVLRGTFGTVRLTACTLDPGTAGTGPAGAAPSAFATSADGRALVPTCLWIEADPAAPAGSAGIRELVVDHCVLGPIRTRNAGILETLTISDSIVQGLPQSTAAELTAADIRDPVLFTRLLKAASDPVSGYLWGRLSAAAQADVTAFVGQAPRVPPLPSSLINDLNQVIDGPVIYDPARFATVALPPAAAALLAEVEAAGGNADPGAVSSLNRMLLEAAYPVAVATAALALADATADLARVTVLGRTAVHRLSADDSILGDFAVVEDSQHGCVRFSAWASGSVLPRRYESVQVPAGAPLFTSQDYGDPGYGQPGDGADHLIVPAGPRPAAPAAGEAAQASGDSVLAGAENGSEMGAFCALLNPVREQALMAKLAEYMPAGLAPLVVHVT